MEKKIHIVVAVVNAHTHKKEKKYIEKKRKEKKGRNSYNNFQVKRADSHSRIRITDTNARSW